MLTLTFPSAMVAAVDSVAVSNVHEHRILYCDLAFGRRQRTVVDPALGKLLGGLVEVRAIVLALSVLDIAPLTSSPPLQPVSFLDLEAVSPLFPLFPNHRPYQTTVTQYSLHTTSPNNTLSHLDFLLSPGEDPSAVWSHLLDSLPPSGSIVVYSHYERTQLLAASRTYPHLSERLVAATGRLWDLEKAVKLVAKRELRGRTSIKVALGAFAPAMDEAYKKLEKVNGLADGGAAQAATVEHLEGGRDWGRELKEYCELDTEAMVGVLGGVREAWEEHSAMEEQDGEEGGGEGQASEQQEKLGKLENLTVRVLKDMARARGLKVSGRKREIIERLQTL